MSTAKTRAKKPATRLIEPKEPPDDETPITIPKYEIERLQRLLDDAAESALDAAPRDVPPMFGRVGAAAAVAAFRTIRMVRDELTKAIEGAL